jgi:Cu-Zn family superoxide dismutase
MRNIILTAAALLLAGCETLDWGPREPQGGPVAALVNTAGQSIGSVRMWESPGAVTFRIEANGLPLGIHGVHVHAVGRCGAPGFTTAGAHWNPAGRQHGTDNPAGPHAGDMPNVTVASNGVLGETVTLAGASFASLMDADGSALVIHADRDDLRTDPSGNSGARIACALLHAP